MMRKVQRPTRVGPCLNRHTGQQKGRFEVRDVLKTSLTALQPSPALPTLPARQASKGWWVGGLDGGLAEIGKEGAAFLPGQGKRAWKLNQRVIGSRIRRTQSRLGGRWRPYIYIYICVFYASFLNTKFHCKRLRETGFRETISQGPQGLNALGLPGLMVKVLGLRVWGAGCI